MSETHTIAQKKRWSKMDKDKRSEVMKKVASKRWAGVPADKRSQHGKLMVDIREKNKKDGRSK